MINYYNNSENGIEINENSIINFAKIKKNELKRKVIPNLTSKVIIKLIICFFIILLLAIIKIKYLNIYIRENVNDLKKIINEIKIKKQSSNKNDYNILEQYKKVNTRIKNMKKI